MAIMNSKHQKTLGQIFANPTPKTLLWSDIEALLIAIGCEVTEGNGSRVKFDFNGHTVAFHRPHPQKETKPYAVRIAKEFLILIEVTP